MTNRDPTTGCNHIPGDGCTLVTAADGCSLECTVCKDVVAKIKLAATILDGDDIEWIG